MGTVDFGREIVSRARKLNALERGITVCPDIEVETQSIATDVESKELLFISDASALPSNQSPKVGMACSLEKFYFCNRPNQSQSFCFDDVKTIEFQGKNRFGTYSPGDQVIIVLNDETQYALGECMLGCDCSGIAQFLLETVENTPSELAMEEKRCVSLCDLPPQLLVNYMEVLYNYAYITDCEIESSEYAALQSIGVRLGLDANVRNKLRDYLFLMQENLRITSGILIKRSRDQMSYGSYEIFRHSLMQDALYLKEVRGEAEPWYNDRFLNSLQQILEISDDQIEVMLAAIQLYKKVQQRDADLQALRSDMEMLQRRSKSLRIPLEAIFCSGSVYSTDTYHGFRRLKKQKKSITRQRELMLQEVIRNTQLSMNRLVEDLNDTTLRLLAEVRKGNIRDQQIQELSSFIRLHQFQKQVDAMIQKSDEVTLTQFYNRLPPKLEARRVAELLPQQRELVESAYLPLPEGGYKIRDDLSYGELSRLTRIEAITDDGEE